RPLFLEEPPAGRSDPRDRRNARLDRAGRPLPLLRDTVPPRKPDRLGRRPPSGPADPGADRASPAPAARAVGRARSRRPEPHAAASPPGPPADVPARPRAGSHLPGGGGGVPGLGAALRGPPAGHRPGRRDVLPSLPGGPGEERP